MQDAIPSGAKKKNKTLKTVLKILITALCLWYVSGKINFTKAGDALQKAHWLYLVPALVLFAASKIVAAFRLNINFRNIGIPLSEWSNIKLYWLGMFYNLFLPGSIGGDAYKVILLTKEYHVPYRKTIGAVLLDRFSGLAGLGILLACYSMAVLKNVVHLSIIFSAVLLAVPALYLVIRRWLKDFLPGFFPTLVLGILVQALQVFSVYFIMTALQIPAGTTEYLFIFLLSSVVSVLPFTIGGLGARELVFLEGAKYFGLITETPVIISLIFYLITLLVSAFGIIGVFRDPLAKKKEGPRNGPPT